MDQELADAAEYMPDAACDSPDGNTFLHEMTSWSLSSNVISEMRLRQSMGIYIKIIE